MQGFRHTPSPYNTIDMSIDKGLRRYMMGVYNHMAVGLLVTGLAAYAIAALATTKQPPAAGALMLGNGVFLTDFGRAIYATPLCYLIMFAPVILVYFLNFKIATLSTSAAKGLFYGYAALVGISLSSIFLTFTATTISQTFFITAAAFGALSLYGYTTKRDLRPMASFLFMSILGIMAASVVNLFLHSSRMQFVISIIGLLLFSGLTAYDTQYIKEFYYEHDDHETMTRKIVMGALNLYLDFINMFTSLLQLLNSERR